MRRINEKPIFLSPALSCRRLCWTRLILRVVQGISRRAAVAATKLKRFKLYESPSLSSYRR